MIPPPTRGAFDAMRIALCFLHLRTFSCFVSRTVLFDIQGFVSKRKSCFLGWLLPGRFLRVFRCSQNLKAVSIAPSRFLVLHSGLFFMAHKDLCQIKTLAFRVAFTGSVPERLSFFTESQVRFNRSLPFSCFAQRTVRYGI